jgi:hypothetical protein
MSDLSPEGPPTLPSPTRGEGSRREARSPSSPSFIEGEGEERKASPLSLTPSPLMGEGWGGGDSRETGGGDSWETAGSDSQEERPILRLPHQWRPRPHQMKLWRFLRKAVEPEPAPAERPGRRAVAVWHRRAGKDSLAANFACLAAHQRVGNYWHMLPTARQGRKVLWEGIDREGRRLIDQAFPPILRAG